MGITRDFANIIRSNGDIVISGDLDVNGTQTTINTTTFVVEDKNIELGANATSNSQNDGAGISILLPDASPDEFATLTYGSTADAWSFNKKVGIGTSSPNTTLTLSDGTDEFDFGVTANQLMIKSVTSDGSDDQRIIIDAGNGGLSSTRGAFIALSGNEASIEAGKSIYQMGNVAGSSHVFRKAGGIDAVTIDSDGNVGIGTANGDVTNDGTASRTYVGIIGTANRGRLNIGSTASNGADAGTLAFTNGANVLAEFVVDTTAGVQNTGNLNINSTDYIRFTTGVSYVEAMRIDSSGNLVFNGSANITSNTADGADNSQIIITGGGSTTSVDTRGASIHLAGNENGNGGLLQLRGGSGSVGGIRFYSGDTERMRITSTGEIVTGGLTSSTAQLHLYKADATGGKLILQSQVVSDATARIDMMSRLLDNSNKTAYIEAYRGNINFGGESGYGNVGIGTDTPASKLHIRTSTNNNYEFEEVSGELRFSALNDARSANVPIQFAASEFNFISGNVGIGVSPEATIKLDVSSGAITTPARFRFSDDNNGATNNILAHEYFAGIEIENVYSGVAPSANGTKIAKLSLTTVTAGGYSAGGSIHTEATSNFYDAGELVFSTGSNSSGNNTERMRITSDGTAIFKKPVAAGGSSSYAAYSGVEGFSTNANTTQTLTFVSNTGSSFLLEVSFSGYASAGAGSFVRQVIDGGHPGGALYHHAIQTASSSSGYTLGTLTETSNGFTFTVTSPGQSGVIYAMYKYVDSDGGLPTFTFV